MTFSSTRRHLGRTALATFVGAAGLVVSGCGWRIRGFDLALPFKTIAISGETGVANEIRQMVFGQPGIKIVQNQVEAEVVLLIMSQTTDRTVVAFSGDGRPRELQLRMRTTYRVTDGFAVELSSPQEISLTRDVTVTESEALAQTSAEAFMQEDMLRDTAQQLIRRLRAIKPAAK